jgi:predicted nucleotidyltransferase
MSSNRYLQEQALTEVCKALGNLQEKTVLVGGAVVGLYADDPAAEDVRATKDVDIVVEVRTLLDLENLREELARKGFQQVVKEKTICRFTLNEILIDVMVPESVGWAPGNRWFASGIESAQAHDLASGQRVRLLPVPYFLAAKFDAYHDRGENPRWSHDLEDILYIVNNRNKVVEEIRTAPDDVKEYLAAEASLLLGQPDVDEILITATTDQGRVELVKDKLQQISGKGTSEN